MLVVFAQLSLFLSVPAGQHFKLSSLIKQLLDEGEHDIMNYQNRG